MAADRSEMKKRILEDKDYVRSPKFSNSLTKFLQKNPDSIVEDKTIARLLMIPEEEVEEIYEEAVAKLRESMEKETDEE